MISRYFLFFTVVFWVVSTQVVFADDCEYTAQIEQCNQANKNGWSPRSITDFVCISSHENSEEMISQIVLDMEFKQIDQEIELYLDNLESDKEKYFWQNAKTAYINGIDEIIEKFSEKGEYWYKYKSLCWIWWIIERKTLACMWWQWSQSRAADLSKESTCMDLTRVKLSLYKQVAFDIIKLNKQQVRKDALKKYFIQQRTKYDKLLDVMMVNLGYMQRILAKWPSKLKKTY